MNKLLPNIYELKPIYGNRDTFGETTFIRDFKNLSFKNKLQVANDLIRQTMLMKEIPNPETEVEEMCGDSYTASVVAIEYLKKMKLGKKHILVLARKKKYEIDTVTTKHFLVLVLDDRNEWYQFDCSPFVGYKCGKVEKISVERFYKEYYPVNEEMKDILCKLRTIQYDINKTGTTNIDVKLILNRAKKYRILQGYISEIELLFRFINVDVIDKNSEIAKLKLLNQIKEWRYELDYLTQFNKDYERQIELSQCITQEWKKYDFSLERFFINENEVIPLSHLTPRYFYEKKTNTVIIKPSAYLIGVNSTIRESFLFHGNGGIGEYQTNLGKVSKDGIKIMRIFHPDGYKYERSMCGTCNIFLIKRRAKELQDIKHSLRDSLGKNLNGCNVTWFDGKQLKWNPIITNLVHSTDNSSETCCHYVSTFPEHQLMTRYMYPNLKLIF